MKIWVLTSEYNEYDQYGEYFEEAFLNKPTSQQLMELTHGNEKYVDHILSGGGREKWENQWWNLKCIEIA